MYAIRLHAGPAVHTVEIQFDYLSPTSSSVGALEVSPDVLMVDWNEVVLYPAGYFSRQIPVTASVNLPAGWQFGTALETAGAGVQTSFKRTDLETLVDSPVYAGRYAKRIDLESGGPAPVHLDLFADRPDYLVTTSDELQAYRALVQQAFRLFGSHHFDHYDFLYSLSDQVQQQGLEHHRSSENGNDPESFTKWDATAFGRDLLPHEFTHSWNGKFRRPADLWTPNYDVPMQNSLLWVYEGQTQYWGQVLTARSGLWTLQQALDQFALTAAYFQAESGRRWRPLQDTTNDEIINPRRPLSWRDWQRFEDYYEEGKLIWLEADTLIRELSGDRRSLDDFARAFFGIDDGSFTPVTYTFDDVVRALNSVQPYDWSAFLRQRLDSSGRPAPLEGLRRGGYRLVYTDTPSEILKADDEQRKHVDLLSPLECASMPRRRDTPACCKKSCGTVRAAKAGLTEGAQILAVNGIAYGDDAPQGCHPRGPARHQPDRADPTDWRSLSGSARRLSRWPALPASRAEPIGPRQARSDPRASTMTKRRRSQRSPPSPSPRWAVASMPVGATGSQHLLFVEHALVTGVHDVEDMRLVSDELVVRDGAVTIGIDLVHHLRGLQPAGIAAGGEAGHFAAAAHEFLGIDLAGVVLVEHREHLFLVGDPLMRSTRCRHRRCRSCASFPACAGRARNSGGKCRNVVRQRCHRV